MCLLVQYRFYIEVLACNFMGQEFWIHSDLHVLIKRDKQGTGLVYILVTSKYNVASAGTVHGILLFTEQASGNTFT
jgi:hypothetical protein